MSDRSVTHSTIVIERNYPASRERVFAAFADPGKKRRWFVGEEGFEIEKFEMDFRIGGHETRSFRSTAEGPVKGATFTNQSCYQDIVPDRRIVIAYTMSMGDRRISASLATFEFVPAGEGTDMIFTEQGAFFEGADGPQMREQGWRQLLEQLAKELRR
jgi:uncharacterized protein YndB with AHSA1/START domain